MTLLIIVFSVIASAFFSGMEIAFISANRLKIELDKQKGKFSAKILSSFVKKQEHFIAAMLLGNNVALVVYGIFMAELMKGPLEQYVQNQAVILLIQTVASTLIILVTAEFLPKAIFRLNPNRLLSLSAPVLQLVYWILFLPTLFTMWLSNLTLRIFGIDVSKSEQAFTKVDLDYYVRDINERMKDEAELDNEIQILQNALDFSGVKARDCMVPRTDIIGLEIEQDIQVLIDTFIESGLSKILIYRDNIDNIIGFVHSFELFKKPTRIKDVMMPVFVIPEAMSGTELLKAFTDKKKSIAVVVDEFGGTAGIATTEDLIEEIFGEIEDEHDVEEFTFEKINDGEYIVAARYEIDRVNVELDFELPESDEYETVGGLMINVLEAIPELNEEIIILNYRLVAEEVEDSRIERVRIYLMDKD
jgi:CBS domain containing-hemolysin-like protein